MIEKHVARSRKRNASAAFSRLEMFDRRSKLFAAFRSLNDQQMWSAILLRVKQNF